MIETAFTRCRHILKTMKNVTAAKFELAFTRCRNNLKTVRDLTVRNSLQDFDAKEAYLHSKSRSISFQKCLKMFGFHHFQVFTRCHFQNVSVRLPFSKSTVFKNCRQKCAVFVWTGGLSVEFLPFSKCAGIVWTQSESIKIISNTIYAIQPTYFTKPCSSLI